MTFAKATKQFITFPHGFISGRCATTNTLSTDITKAFNLVQNNINLRKLDNFGLSTDLIQYFASYLADRTNYVEYQETYACVPIGPALGPILFLIFFDNVPNYIASDLLL